MICKRPQTSPFRNYQANTLPEAIYRGLFRQIRDLINQKSNPNCSYDLYIAETKYSSKGAGCKGYMFKVSALGLCGFITDVVWSMSIARQLLEAGTIVGKLNFYREKDSYPELTSLHIAVIKSKPDLLQILLESLDTSIHISCPAVGSTPLHLAVHYPDQIKILKILIDYCKEHSYTIDPLNNLGYTPLIESIRCLNFAAADLLLKNGASYNLASSKKNISESNSFEQFYESMKAQVLAAPYYIRAKMKRTLWLNRRNDNGETVMVMEKLIEAIRIFKLDEAPSYDMRNKEKWVTRRPISSHDVKDSSEINDLACTTLKCWKDTIPSMFSKWSQQQCLNYRKSNNLEQLLNNLRDSQLDDRTDKETHRRYKNQSINQVGKKNVPSARFSSRKHMTKR